MTNNKYRKGQRKLFYEGCKSVFLSWAVGERQNLGGQSFSLQPPLVSTAFFDQ